MRSSIEIGKNKQKQTEIPKLKNTMNKMKTQEKVSTANLIKQKKKICEERAFENIYLEEKQQRIKRNKENPWNLWNMLKTANFCLIGISEEEIEKVTKFIKEIIVENSLNLVKYIAIKVHEAQNTQIFFNSKKTSSSYVTKKSKTKR